MKKCVKLILSNNPASLHHNWKNQIKGSPMMMQESLLKLTLTKLVPIEANKKYYTIFLEVNFTALIVLS